MRNFEDKILRKKVTTRGGGVEIALDAFGYDGEKMTAYQNYLGGGLLGRVMSDCTVRDWRDDNELVSISEDLKKLYHSWTNPNTEWESATYEENQNRSGSAY